jgi:hypothetical protein
VTQIYAKLDVQERLAAISHLAPTAKKFEQVS